MAAQGYQESGLDQSKRSHVGAIGVMQVMPATARDKAVNIPDIEKLESNIHAGHQVQPVGDRQLLQRPGDRPVDRALFAFASYNAGPGGWRACARRPKARASTRTAGSTTWSWSRPKRIGRETVTYVGNIYKYYLAYQMMMQREQSRRTAKAETKK